MEKTAQNTGTFGQILNKDLSSSMRYINLEGLNKEQIIDKYEQLLCQREKHYKELVLQMGETNQKYITIQDKVDELMKINEDLNISIVKTETQIQQEQVSKELWFIKLDYLIKEHDNLKAKLNGTYTRENRNKNSETRSENKEKKRTLSVDAIENRSQFIRNKTMNLIDINHKLNNETEKSSTIKEDIKDNTKTVKKKHTHKHKKDKENGKLSLTMKKPKKLASENIDYVPVFK